ncbi:MAG: c-type cytochrome [Acidobacteria bacterium]|nr:c-type cytochrome [Acidobacteriota bacterium]
MLFRAVFTLCALAGLAAGQESTVAITNPFTTPLDIEEGSRTFLSQCANCHGRDGRGGQGTPDLTTGNFRRASSDEGLFQVVSRGVSGTTMPAFSLSGRSIWQTLAYVRSLSAGRTRELAKGDAGRGAALFESQGCLGCHSRQGKGGASGPDLTEIGSERTLQEIRTSLLDPQGDVAPGFWRLRAQTRDGRTVEGLRLNEDTYSVQYMDGSGRLSTLMKSDVARFEVDRRSPMPALKGKLSGPQIEDLVAFLVGGKR